MWVPFYASYAVLWILVIFQGLVLIGLVRTIYRLRRDGAATVDASRDLRGYEVPAFSAIDLGGNRIESWKLADQLTALLFVSPSCDSCALTLAEIEALNVKAKGNVVVICQATSDECAHLADAQAPRFPVVADEDLVISRLFRVRGVPTAVLISSNRIQSYGQPMRREELSEMFDEQQREEVSA